ncbi:unnamed protein product [Closterium sp. NIES-64]|nr:unnamed protein product [Closterium sp. NIES-64]
MRPPRRPYAHAPAAPAPPRALRPAPVARHLPTPCVRASPCPAPVSSPRPAPYARASPRPASCALRPFLRTPALRPLCCLVSFCTRACLLALPSLLVFSAAAPASLSSLLPESEEAHFTQVRTASEFLTAIKARYTTPTTVSLGRLFLPFLFPDLASFERSADLIAHLRSLDSSYRAACTDAQLALLPPPMAITIYFIATSLPDRLASVHDTLLLKHPSELTIEVLDSALKDVESNLRSVASASGAVPPPLFHGCTVPQLPTFTASLATAATDVTAAAVTTSSRSRGRGGKRDGQGTGGGGGGGVGGGGGGGGVPTCGGGSAGPGEVSRAAAGDTATAASGGDAQARQPPSGLPAAAGGVAAWYLAQRQQQ